MLKRSLFFISFIFSLACGSAVVAQKNKPEESASPIPVFSKIIFKNRAAVSFSKLPNNANFIRYTLDGSTPKANSTTYDGTSIHIAKSLTIKAAYQFKNGSIGNFSKIECTEENNIPSPNNKTYLPKSNIQTKKQKQKNYTAAINVDISDAPHLREWAHQAQANAETFYPQLCELLASDGYDPPRQILLYFKKDMKGVAHASGNKITIAADWIKKSPGDHGMVIHELTHVVQQYRGGGPGWLVEGIADWTRFWIWEPENKSYPDPDRHNYNGSYRITAAFLGWLVETKDPEFVTKINAALREKRFKLELFKKYTGKNPADLWQEYKKYLKDQKD